MEPDDYLIIIHGIGITLAIVAAVLGYMTGSAFFGA